MKQIKFKTEAREKLKRGLDAVVDAVKVTIGPNGRNVVIDRGVDPIVANDGGLIAREIALKDKIENIGASIVKGVVNKTSEKVGGGRTASAILTQAIVSEGLKYSEMGANMLLLKKGINEAAKDIIEKLQESSKPVKTKEQLKQVATISTESEELGTVIADTIDKIGKDGVVTVEESQGFEITTEITEGLKFDKGYISPYFVTNPERMEAEYKDVPILLTDKKIAVLKDILPVLEVVAGKGKRELVIIAEDLEGEALSMTVFNKIKGSFNILAIKVPGFGDHKKLILEDLAATTGAEVVDETVSFKDAVLGSAKKVLSTKDHTVIVDGAGDLKAHIKKLKNQLENTENKWEKEKYKERIAKLTNGIAVLKVGAATETELKYLKLKIEDGVNETKRALEEGIVIGGNASFVNAAKLLKPKKTNDEIAWGYNLMLKAIESPLQQIIENGNGEPQVVINELKKSDSQTIGYDALKGEIVSNMENHGIIDSLKVARTVLENAVSAASMFLTIEVAISDEPLEEVKQKIDY